MKVVVPKLKGRNLLLGSIGICFILLVWWVLYLKQSKGSYLVPDPLKTFRRVYDFLFKGGIYRDLGETLYRMLAGYFLAGVFGIGCGLLLGSFRTAKQMFSGLIDFLRGIPVTALYPAFVMLFGIGSQSKIAMIFWASFFIICINTSYGVAQTNPVRRTMAKLYGADWLQVFFKITIYDALPHAMIGLRIGLSYSLIVSILTEMFMGSQYGLGQKLTEAYNLYQIDAMFALILIIGAVGYLLNLLFIQIEKKAVAWKFHED